jgi:hypothetical protein
VRETPSGLAVVEDFRRGQPTGTFAAARVDLTDDHARRRATAGSNSWQKEAWEYNDEIEEVKFAAGFRSALMRRLALYVGFTANPGTAPTPVEDTADIPAEIALAAVAELERLGSPDQQAELLGQWGGIATVSGESYLIGRPDLLADTGENWTLYSESNMVRGTTGNAVAVRTRPGGTPEDLDDAATIRIWRRHPRWPDLADANMRAVLGTAEEILIYARQMRAVGKSRTAAPVLYVANEIGDPPNPDGKPTLRETNLVTSLVSAITDDTSPAAVAPQLVRGPASFGRGTNAVAAKDAIFTVDLSRKLDDKAIDRITFLVKRLAHGLDVPVEVITGVADVNHWTAWQIEDSTYKSHIEPDALIFANAITAELLRPGLLELFGPAAVPFIRRVTVAVNPSALVVRPNRSKDALDAFDRWAISWDALREHLAFGEDEAPDEAEMLMRLALTRSIGAATITAPMLEETGLFPTAIDGMAEVAEAQANAAANAETETKNDINNDSEIDNSGDSESIPDDTQPDSAAARGIAGVFGASDAVLADARARLRGLRSAPGKVARQLNAIHTTPQFAERQNHAPGLGERLGSIDRELLDRLLMAASENLTNALRVIGNRLRTQAQGNPAAAEAVKGVPADQVAHALLQAGLPLPDLEALAADQFDQLSGRWDAWVPAAFAATSDAITRATPDSDDLGDRVNDEVTAGQEDRSTSGRGRLVAAMIALAVARTMDPFASTPDGESDDLIRVPAGIVRQSLAAAGGVTSPGAAPLGLAGEIGPGSSAGMLATGPQAQRALRIAGYTVSAWEWHHSLMSTPLPVHSALDGVTFTDWHDDKLLNTAPFPVFAYLFPGDHHGCKCSTTPVLTPITEG